MPEINFNPREYANDASRFSPEIFDERQKISVLEDYYIQGGFHICDTTQGPLPYTEVGPIPNYRNYITFDRRKLGMITYTLDDGKFWQLINNRSATFPSIYDPTDRTITTNSDWIELNILNSFSGITYNNVTGEFKISFSRTSSYNFAHSTCHSKKKFNLISISRAIHTKNFFSK